MLLTSRRPSHALLVLLCAALVSPSMQADSMVPNQTYCAADFVFEAGTCDESEIPVYLVEYNDASHSATCPPNTGCESTVTVTMEAASGTRFQGQKRKHTEHLSTSGCDTADEEEIAIYSGMPLELACAVNLIAVCSACQ